MLIGPHYSHDEQLMVLPRGLALPTFRNCSLSLRNSATFWVAAFHTDSYRAASERLVSSCSALDICCVSTLVPPGSVDGMRDGEPHHKHRLIALKVCPAYRTPSLRCIPIVIGCFP